jgi:SHS2 domain-containing protein
MKKYEVIDISGDVGLRVQGINLKELFANAAFGMSELITDTVRIPESEQKEVNLESDTTEGLLVLWLNELIFLFDTYDFTGRKFNVMLRGTTLTAKISGGFFNPAVNEKRLLLKAATYHKLSLKKNSFWEATIIFDI